MADVAAIGDALTVAAAAEQRAKSEDCAGMEDIAVLSKLLEEMAPPPAMGLEAPLDEKYAFITANKGTGNNEFKAKRYASAIKIYIDAVEALSRECYPSRERMMWDYAARELVAQCYSNAAASALKLAQQKVADGGDGGGDDAEGARANFAHAATLCEAALQCKPEGSDLVKVLHRHGQALLALQRPEEAKAALERAADKEPNNRAVREELVKAKRAVKALLVEGERALFNGVDLRAAGLTSKKEQRAQEMRHAIEAGFEALLDGNDEEALKHFLPLCSEKMSADSKFKPQTMQAAYGAGMARYHRSSYKEAASLLSTFFTLLQELRSEGADIDVPLLGIPIARFYLAHSLFNSGGFDKVAETLNAYFQDVQAAGPQQVLNMPDGWMGKKISEADRKASRFRARASSAEALCDAHTLLAIVAERSGGAAAALPHCIAAAAAAEKPEQRANALENLMDLHAKLGDTEKEAETRAALAAVKDEIETKKRAQKEREEKEAAEREATKSEGEPIAEVVEEEGAEQGAEALAGTEVEATR